MSIPALTNLSSDGPQACFFQWPLGDPQSKLRYILSQTIRPAVPGMSNQWQWADRRSLFQRGKEVHEPSSPAQRRPSGSSGTTDAVKRASVGSNNSLDKTTSNSTMSTDSSASPSSQRRRSSNTGLFGNLATMKRGSADYSQRRESYGDTQTDGAFSGWYSKTFKGIQARGTADAAQGGGQAGAQQERRGVME